MPQPKNAMEIFQLLDKSNCQECREKTCLAFAGAVFTGQKRLDECPKLDRETIERFSGKSDSPPTIEENRDEYLIKLSDSIKGWEDSEIAREFLNEIVRDMGGADDEEIAGDAE